MKKKLYLKIGGALEVRAFTNEKQVKSADRVVEVDEKEIEKILDMRVKFSEYQLTLDELWKKGSFVEVK